MRETWQKSIAGNNGGTQALRPVAVVIGITSFEPGGREDAHAYSAFLGQKLTWLRNAGIPIVWGAIAPGGNKLLLPENPRDNRPFDFDTLVQLGFEETQGKGEHFDIHRQFLDEYGPRRNEAVYRKPTQDTLLTYEDTLLMGTAQKIQTLNQGGFALEDQGLHGNAGIQIIRPDQINQTLYHLFPDQSLGNYLRDMGYNRSWIIGAISHFCCTDTGVSGAQKELNPAIVTDGVLSWDRVVNSVAERQKALMVWGGPQQHPYHRAKIAEKLDMILHDPVRNYTPEQKDKIRRIELKTFDELAAHDLQVSAEPSGPAPS